METEKKKARASKDELKKKEECVREMGLIIHKDKLCKSQFWGKSQEK